MIQEEAIKKILVVIPNWVGDAISSTPILSTLHRGFSRASLSILANRSVSPLFLNHPHEDYFKIW